MYRGDNYLDKPQFEQGTEPSGLEAKLGQTDAPAANRFDYADRQGRTHDVQTWKSGDATRVRAYDRGAGQPPERLSIGQSGYANGTLERDPHTGQVDRMRINDIQTTEGYRNSGLGSQMLRQTEAEAHKAGAREIYGSLSYEPQNEQAVRGFYEKHGYSFRPGPGGGEEVYKRLK